MATPRPMPPRRATIGRALASRTTRGLKPAFAHAASSAARTPVPWGRLTSGWSRRSSTVMLLRNANGLSALTAATSASSATTAASSPGLVPPADPISARSRRPSRSNSIRRSEASSDRAMLTPGKRSWNSASNSGRVGSEHPLTIPTATCPRTRPTSWSTARRALVTASRAARANGSTAAPTSVSRTDRPERSRSCWPSSASSRRTCALTPGWATCTRAAARVKLASSATATKYSS